MPREALGAVIKAWQQTADGKDVSFTQSYGASGDQARAVAAGLKADVVQLSTGLDIELFVKVRARRFQAEPTIGEGDRDELDRGIRRTGRQPEEDQELE